MEGLVIGVIALIAIFGLAGSGNYTSSGGSSYSDRWEEERLNDNNHSYDNSSREDTSSSSSPQYDSDYRGGHDQANDIIRDHKF